MVSLTLLCFTFELSWRNMLRLLGVLVLLGSILGLVQSFPIIDVTTGGDVGTLVEAVARVEPRIA